MIKAMVVDDENLTNEYICMLLRKSGIDVKGYTNSYEALENIRIYEPDVLFLDIEMPEITGLDLAKKVQKNKYECEVIFITAYSQYALNAFDVSALDYLLKPIMPDGLNRALERVKKRISMKSEKQDNCVYKNIKISLFGIISLQLGENQERIRWITSKCAEIFAFMLLSREEDEVSKWRLISEIWPEKDSEKGDINLRSTVSRLNKTFRENSLKINLRSIGNGYKLEMDESNIEVDAFKLENYVINVMEIDEKNLNEYESIIFSYNSTFLESINNEWSYSVREKYHRYFIIGANELLKYYEKTNSEQLKILKVMELIVKYEPYDEYIREKVLNLYYKIYGKLRAEKYYKEYCKLIKNDLGSEPSESIKRLYAKLL